jgi:sialic acid synthase SpsE
MRMRIGNRWIGDGEPCYIVAEVGSNHNGSFEQALRLIDAAADAGADAVKFQSFKAARLYPRSAGRSDYLQSARSIYDIIEAMEMPDAWIAPLAEHCRGRSVEFLASPFDEESVDQIDPHVNAFKIASYEMTHAPLLAHVARKKKPVIVSTGTASLDEVLAAVERIRGAGSDRIVLLQCTACYPAPLDSVNVRAVATLRAATGLLTGLSDHSRDPIVAPMTAVALGASVIEKHYTLSNRLPGPDHAFAVEPRELAEMVRRVREVEQALGTGAKEPHAVEAELRQFARRAIFSTRPIAADEVLTVDNVAVLRAGKLEHGLEPACFPDVLGRRARRDIPAESPIRAADYV